MIKTSPVGTGLDPEQFARTIDYVSSQGVKVINNSWGAKYLPGDMPTSMTASMAEYEEANFSTIAALRRAQDRGAVIVFAAGNDGLPFPTAPATLPSIDPSVASKAVAGSSSPRRPTGVSTPQRV